MQPINGNDSPAGGAKPSLLSVRDLCISFKAAQREVAITKDVSFSIAPGEQVGMVGESGCGKSVTSLSILGLLPPESARVSGCVEFEGRNLLSLNEREMRSIRGRDIAMIFQEPMSALDPVFTVGHQIAEAYRAHFLTSRAEAHERVVDALDKVGIALPERRYHEYPHQLSGGMQQRAMIAMALICNPKLLIADEPTTALDVTIQAQVLKLLRDTSERTGTALLLISHDLGVVAETCTRMVTMYAGQVVEDGPMDDVLMHPMHPYTSGLLHSLPRLSERRSKLPSIRGHVPSPTAMPQGCRFMERCMYSEPDRCSLEQKLVPVDGLQHLARCVRSNELNLPGVVT